MHQVLVVLVDIFLVLNHGELQKPMELLELEVGLLVVEMVVNIITPPMVNSDQTTKAVAVVKGHTMILATTKVLAMVLLTLVEVVEEDQVTIMVEETKVELKQEQEVLVLFL